MHSSFTSHGPGPKGQMVRLRITHLAWARRSLRLGNGHGSSTRSWIIYPVFGQPPSLATGEPEHPPLEVHSYLTGRRKVAIECFPASRRDLCLPGRISAKLAPPPVGEASTLHTEGSPWRKGQLPCSECPLHGLLGETATVQCPKQLTAEPICAAAEIGYPPPWWLI